MKQELVIDIFSEVRDIIDTNMVDNETKQRISVGLDNLHENLLQDNVRIGFKFSWRDLIRWSGAIAVAITFVILPLIQLVIPHIKTPEILVEISWQILSFTFGFAGLATFEKLKIKK